MDGQWRYNGKIYNLVGIFDNASAFCYTGIVRLLKGVSAGRDNMDLKNDNGVGKVLVCWIGDTDLLALGSYGKRTRIPSYYVLALRIFGMDDDKRWTREKIEQEIDNLDTSIRDSSILLTLGKDTKPEEVPHFNKVLLLTNRPSRDQSLLNELEKVYPAFVRQRLGNQGDLDQTEIAVQFVPSADNPQIGVDPWDHAAVYEATNKVLETHLQGFAPEDVWYNITPGTIAQQISMVLIGKERQPNTKNFIQVNKGRRLVSKCSIPFDFGKVVENTIERRARLIADDAFPIIGKAQTFLAALKKAERVAHYPISVLLTGETGTGKEVFARRIHNLSGRPAEKFFAINCSMLSRDTGVAELTGYFRGAFTGAEVTTPGYYEKAKGGTLFLDEIGDCPIDVQAELLRFLQPIGKEKPTMRHWRLKGRPPSDIKKEEKPFKDEQQGDILVIAATNRDVRNPDTFRQDLFYRLSTIQIKIPSLEDRKKETNVSDGIDDIKDLADSFLEECNETFGFSKSEYRQLSPDAYDALRAHVWEGNIRELKNTIARIVVLSDMPTISAEMVQANLDSDASTGSDEPRGTLGELLGKLAKQDVEDVEGHGRIFDKRMAEIKRLYCKAALNETNGNKKKAYTALGINPKTFDGCL